MDKEYYILTGAGYLTDFDHTLASWGTSHAIGYVAYHFNQSALRNAAEAYGVAS